MRKLLLPAVVIFAAAFTAGEPAHAAGAFDVCFATKLANATPGAASDIQTTIGTGLGPDCVDDSGDEPDGSYQFGTIAHFTPPQWHVAKDADLPDGMPVGEISTVAALGLLNNPCVNQLTIGGELLDGTTSTANPIDPLPDGTADRLKPLSTDADGNGIPDAADRWPSYLSALATPSGWDLSALVSRHVAVPRLPAAGNVTFVFNLLVFEPGSTFAPGLTPDPTLGYVTVLILNDPTSSGSAANLITDTCSPASIQWETLGAAIGVPIRKNPLDGEPRFTLFAVPLADVDNDGFENALDTCPYDENLGDARTNPNLGDRDHDGIDDTCDPESNSGCGFFVGRPCDADGDRWATTADNCPLTANVDQADADHDAVGDACDRNPDTPDGEMPGGCLTNRITIGGSEATVTASGISGGNACIAPAAGSTASPDSTASPVKAQPLGPTNAGGPSGGSTSPGWLVAALGAAITAAGAWTVLQARPKR